MIQPHNDEWKMIRTLISKTHQVKSLPRRRVAPSVLFAIPRRSNEPWSGINISDGFAWQYFYVFEPRLDHPGVSIITFLSRRGDRSGVIMGSDVPVFRELPNRYNGFGPRCLPTGKCLVSWHCSQLVAIVVLQNTLFSMRSVDLRICKENWQLSRLGLDVGYYWNG